MKRSEIEIGINLYSVRDYCKTAEDLDKTLGRLATIGYKAVQVSGIGPIDTTTVKQWGTGSPLDRTGWRMSGSVDQ